MVLNPRAAPGENDLRSLRETAGFSQQRVAELAGCSLAAVALFERGYRPSTSKVLPRIVAVLNDGCTNGETRPVTGSRTNSAGGDGRCGSGG